MKNSSFRDLSIKVCDICFFNATKKVVVSHPEIVAEQMSQQLHDKMKKKRDKAEIESMRKNLQKKLGKEINPNLSESEDMDLE